MNKILYWELQPTQYDDDEFQTCLTSDCAIFSKNMYLVIKISLEILRYT